METGLVGAEFTRCTGWLGIGFGVVTARFSLAVGVCMDVGTFDGLVLDRTSPMMIRTTKAMNRNKGHPPSSKILVTNMITARNPPNLKYAVMDLIRHPPRRPCPCRPAHGLRTMNTEEIGRAQGRERVCQYG